MITYQSLGAQHKATSSTPDGTDPTADRYQRALQRTLASAGQNVPAATSRTPARQLAQVLIRDVMTRNVISVSEQAPFKDIVEALARRKVSALPVVDEKDRVVGIVSETDLLVKLAATPDPSTRVPGGRQETAATRRKAEGETAADVMSAPAFTLRADDTVIHAARRAAGTHLRRLPVVDNQGVLIGVVTRSDLLRVFLRPDAEILCDVSQTIYGERFRIAPAAVDVEVRHGVVTLTGQVEERTISSALVSAARTVAGVVAVHDQLDCRVDPFAQSQTYS